MNAVRGGVLVKRAISASRLNVSVGAFWAKNEATKRMTDSNTEIWGAEPAINSAGGRMNGWAEWK